MFDVFQSDRDGRADPPGLATEVDPHQGQARDPQGQRHELGSDVQRIAPDVLPPAPEHGAGRIRHDSGQGGDPR